MSCLENFSKISLLCRVIVQGVKSLGDHFACLCQEFDFYEVQLRITLLLEVAALWGDCTFIPADWGS